MEVKQQNFKEKSQVVSLLPENSYRMELSYYLNQGGWVGSGAIEAAHRTVAQQQNSGGWERKGAKNESPQHEP